MENWTNGRAARRERKPRETIKHLLAAYYVTGGMTPPMQKVSGWWRARAAIIMCPATNPGWEEQAPEAWTKREQRRGAQLADVDNEITNDAPRWMSFRENYRILFPPLSLSLFFFFFLPLFFSLWFFTNGRRNDRLFGRFGRSSTRKLARERERGRKGKKETCIAARSTETVKFPALVLTPGALSCCKSIAGSSKSESSEIYENTPPAC